MELIGLIYSPTLWLVVVTTYLIYFWTAKRRPTGMPPGPIAVPVLGGYHVLGMDATTLPHRFTEVAKKYGNIFSVQMPSERWLVVLNDMNSLKEAFIKKGIEYAGRPFDHYPIVQNIINPHYPKSGIIFGNYDDQWKLQRHTAMTILRSLGFGKKSIEVKILEEVENLNAEIEKMKRNPFNPSHFLDNAVANIICALLFGERYEYDDKEFEELQHNLDELFEMNVRASRADIFWFAKYFPSMKHYLKRLEVTVEKLNSFIEKKTSETQKRLKEGYQPSDFIGLYLIELAKPDTSLKNRSLQLVQDFFAAGTETTAITLTWALYFMAKYPKVQQKVYEEILKVVGNGRRPVLKDREHLPYSEAAISEIMRLGTTTPLTVPHNTMCDTEVFGYKIPKDTEVWGNLWAIVRDPQIFPHPEEFNPERFLNNKGEFVKNDCLVLFGVGRRSCLGEQLARQELFLFFTHIIQKFELTVPQGKPLPPAEGIWAITNKCPRYQICAMLRE